MYDNFINNWKKVSYPAVKILYLLKWLKVLEQSSQYYYLWKRIEEFILGKVSYGGILLPSDTNSKVTNDNDSDNGNNESAEGSSTYLLSSPKHSNTSFLPFASQKKPLILWGITLGITSDLVKKNKKYLIYNIKYIYIYIYIYVCVCVCVCVNLSKFLKILY